MKRTVFLIVLLVIELFLTIQFSIKIVSILQASTRIDSRRLERDTLLGTLMEKEAQLAYVRTDMYVEEIAREKLRYSTSGERLYVVNTERTATPVLARVEDSFFSETPWWAGAYSWYVLFFG